MNIAMSIMEVSMQCQECGFVTVVAECVPAIDDEGHLGCPVCNGACEETKH